MDEENLVMKNEAELRSYSGVDSQTFEPVQSRVIVVNASDPTLPESNFECIEENPFFGRIQGQLDTGEINFIGSLRAFGEIYTDHLLGQDLPVDKLNADIDAAIRQSSDFLKLPLYYLFKGLGLFDKLKDKRNDVESNITQLISFILEHGNISDLDRIMTICSRIYDNELIRRLLYLIKKFEVSQELGDAAKHTLDPSELEHLDQVCQVLNTSKLNSLKELFNHLYRSITPYTSQFSIDDPIQVKEYIKHSFKQRLESDSYFGLQQTLNFFKHKLGNSLRKEFNQMESSILLMRNLNNDDYNVYLDLLRKRLIAMPLKGRIKLFDELVSREVVRRRFGKENLEASLSAMTCSQTHCSIEDLSRILKNKGVYIVKQRLKRSKIRGVSLILKWMQELSDYGKSKTKLDMDVSVLKGVLKSWVETEVKKLELFEIDMMIEKCIFFGYITAKSVTSKPHDEILSNVIISILWQDPVKLMRDANLIPREAERIFTMFKEPNDQELIKAVIGLIKKEAQDERKFGIVVPFLKQFLPVPKDVHNSKKRATYLNKSLGILSRDPNIKVLNGLIDSLALEVPDFVDEWLQSSLELSSVHGSIFGMDETLDAAPKTFFDGELKDYGIDD
ncbi:hypothetical protein ACOME3_001017 [Neoechinorhynchus agilis]